jgi:hypothetical protein
MRLKFEATDAAGKVHKRSSLSHIYSHCVVIHFSAHPPSKLWPKGIAACSHAEWAASSAGGRAQSHPLAQGTVCRGRRDPCTLPTDGDIYDNALSETISTKLPPGSFRLVFIRRCRSIPRNRPGAQPPTTISAARPTFKFSCSRSPTVRNLSPEQAFWRCIEVEQ